MKEFQSETVEQFKSVSVIAFCHLFKPPCYLPAYVGSLPVGCKSAPSPVNPTHLTIKKVLVWGYDCGTTTTTTTTTNPNNNHNNNDCYANYDILCALFFRSTTQNHPTFNKDIVLLPHPEWSEVCKHKTRRRLPESGYILSAFEIRKMWDCRMVIAEITEAFKDRIPEDFRYCWNILNIHGLIDT